MHDGVRGRTVKPTLEHRLMSDQARAESLVPPLSQGQPPTDRSQARHWRRRPLVALLFLVVAAVGAAWWSAHRPPSMRYATASVDLGAIERTVTATGTVNPELTIMVGSYVSGAIQELYCDYNTRVKAGQVCAKIDPRPYQAALDQSSGQLQRDQAMLEKDRADLARYQKLAQENSIARQQAEDQIYLVHQDEGTVAIDQALVEAARLNLSYTDIVSPVDGTVVSRNVTQGQTVASSFQTPTLFLIVTDLAKMEVDTSVSESDIGGVKESDKATFTVDAYPRRVFEGTVTQVRQSPQTVQNVVTFDAVVGVSNADGVLMPGMTAATRIVIDQKRGVVRVPNQALRYVPGGITGGAAPSVSTGAAEETRVWVLRARQAVPITVVPGLDDENYTEIAQGDLRAGDQVITAEESESAAGRSSLPLPRL
jgi:HlyD family secretion protein